ncbi:hypothetical protein MLD38_031787 [Melastoma candidum]|uniref:Uncharacterized protein n=1 Tax=Melastoma candidum TaxID=119954 RepID=A0ACB9MRD1_9MYRT|nr:hypothetical protein MLD38_031787 [Melastoma candidum]
MSSLKGIFQDVRNELGNISRKGFDLSFGLRSHSHRVVQDSSVVVDSMKQSCWANMPTELLRDVLMRIEESEDIWPRRKNVVACAGVCRSWRAIMKEIVKAPEISGQLSFPVSLKQPGPRGSLIQCYIKRNRSNQTFSLYLSLNSALYDDGKFLLVARKLRWPTCTEYIISLNSDDVYRGSGKFIGKLRSNFLGTKFIIYDTQPPSAGARVIKSRSTRLASHKQVSSAAPAGTDAVAHLTYELNALGSRGPRRMKCAMDSIPASCLEPGGVAPMQTELLSGTLEAFPSFSFFRSRSTRMEKFKPGTSSSALRDERLVLKNKDPRWHEQLQCWCLNFNGRVTLPSVKNFQLVASPESMATGSENENAILQFGKVEKDVFTMDYQYPISAFQAFAICLSSFDTKIACE